jgi:hypothetical protein
VPTNICKPKRSSSITQLRNPREAAMLNSANGSAASELVLRAAGHQKDQHQTIRTISACSASVPPSKHVWRIRQCSITEHSTRANDGGRSSARQFGGSGTAIAKMAQDFKGLPSCRTATVARALNHRELGGLWKGKRLWHRVKDLNDEHDRLELPHMGSGQSRSDRWQKPTLPPAEPSYEQATSSKRNIFATKQIGKRSS